MCIGLFLFWSLYKTNRFHVAVGLFSNRSQRTSKCGKNNSDTRAALLCFYDILTSSVIYYWTDARQHGIYLLNRYVDDVTGNLFTLFCSTWLVVLIHWWLWDYFGLKQVKKSKKKLARAIYKEEKWRNGEKKSSLQLKNA